MASELKLIEAISIALSQIGLLVELTPVGHQQEACSGRPHSSCQDAGAATLAW